MEYVISDIKKKQRSFRIGVFTIFLVVSFISMLKGVVDVAPIAMLKVAQDQAGCFDF
jgi:Na+/H+ antiporter NhaC